MFDRLKRAFYNAAKTISQKELTEKDLDEGLFDLNMALLESDVSQEVIDDLTEHIKKNLIGLKLQKNESAESVILATLKNNFLEILTKGGSIDLISLINAKKQKRMTPFVIVFLGINGTGKTTTVAKVANLLKKHDLSVVIAAADTHRAGAIEQISSHADRLSVKVISQRYGADPSAVARDALEYAKKHYVDVVLVDTAGRMQTAKNLMDEISKIVKVIKPDIKIFIGDSLAGNDTINQAREFFSYTEFDGAILTKSDADAKGGAAISISYITSKPIIYLGMGQGYNDLIPFNKNKFIATIFNQDPLIESPENISLSKSENVQSSNLQNMSVEKEAETQKINSLDGDEIMINAYSNFEKNQNSDIYAISDQYNEFHKPKINDKTEFQSTETQDGDMDSPLNNNYSAIKISENVSDHSNSKEKDNNFDNISKSETVIDQNESSEQFKEHKKKKGLFGWLKK